MGGAETGEAAAPVPPSGGDNVSPCEILWFSPNGSVTWRPNRAEVLVGGYLITSFRPDDTSTRNAVLAGMAADPHVHLGRLSAAFRVSLETLRKMRRSYEEQGVEGVVGWRRQGRPCKLTPALRARLFNAFASGLSVSEAHEQVKRRLSRGGVGSVRQQWERAERERARALAFNPTLPPPDPASDEADQASGLDVFADPSVGSAPESESFGSAQSAPTPSGPDTNREREPNERPPESAHEVQHLGSWLMIATVASMGLYQHALTRGAQRALKPKTIRLALDAVIAALCCVEPCVEGVRRIATPTAHLLLRARRAPSPPWVRQTLGKLAAREGGALFQYDMACEYLNATRATNSKGPVVFYVDNHYLVTQLIPGLCSRPSE